MESKTMICFPQHIPTEHLFDDENTKHLYPQHKKQMVAHTTEKFATKQQRKISSR